MTTLEIILFLNFIIISIFAYVNKYKALDSAVMYFLSILLCSASAFQYLILDPNDYNQYKIIFQKYPDGFSSVYMQGHELGFNFLIWLFKLLNFSYESFIFFIVLVLFYGIMHVLKLFNKDKLFIFLSIITLVVSFNLTSNLYRQAIAVSIVLMVLVRNRSFVSQFAIVLIATMFHISAITMLPYLFMQKNKSLQVLFIILLLSLVLYFARIDGILLNIIGVFPTYVEFIPYSSLTRVAHNIEGSDKIQYAYRSYYFLSTILILFFVFNYKKIANRGFISMQANWRFINFLTYGVFLYGATYKIGSMSRLGIYFYILIPIILYICLNSVLNNRDSKIILMCFSYASLLGLFFVKNLHFNFI